MQIYLDFFFLDLFLRDLLRLLPVERDGWGGVGGGSRLGGLDLFPFFLCSSTNGLRTDPSIIFCSGVAEDGGGIDSFAVSFFFSSHCSCDKRLRLGRCHSLKGDDLYLGVSGAFSGSACLCGDSVNPCDFGRGGGGLFGGDAVDPCGFGPFTPCDFLGRGGGLCGA